MIAQHPAQEQAPELGLTRETDLDDLRTLDSITIEFTRAEGTTGSNHKRYERAADEVLFLRQGSIPARSKLPWLAR